MRSDTRARSALSLTLALAAAVLLVAVAGVEARAEPADVLCARGIERYQAGELRAAVSLLQQAVAQAPEHVAAGHYLGLALLRLGRLSEGRRALAAAAQAQEAVAGEEPGAPSAEESRLLLDLGQAYLAEGNAAWAVRTLTRARELAPEDALVRRALGRALLRLGDSAAAVEELRQAQRLPGERDGRTALDLGLALYLGQHFDESREAIAPALGGAHAAAARQLLRAAFEAEGVPAAWVSGEVAIGAVVDTNPFYLNETTASDQSRTSTPTAVGPTVAASLVLRPWVTPRNSVWGELAGTRSFYFGEEPASTGEEALAPGDGSPSEIRAAAFYARRFQVEERPVQVSLGYSFGVTFLDGATLADKHHLFLEQHAGHLALQKLDRHGGGSQLRYSLIRSDFFERARSNLGHDLALEHSLSLLDERLRILGWLSFRHETADSADYDAIAPSLGVGASLLVPLDLVLGLRLGYEYKDHLSSAKSQRWDNTQRIDHNLGFTVEVGRALPWSLRLRAVYQRTQNFSTVTTFDYGRDLVSLALSWSTR